jgi:saccharopine dehydrogenase-like NADP-dependent oxidoreductase
MKRVIVLGAGKIGTSIAKLLAECGDYHVTLVDAEQQALDRLEDRFTVCKKVLDVANEKALVKELSQHDAVVSACAFNFNHGIAKAALKAGVSYFDLTEDVATTTSIRQLAQEARDGQIFMPQCGLAPGFIGILGHHMFNKFERVSKVKMRVGALPQFPSNMMMYNLTWSTDGLINEYCNPCEAILDGERVTVQSLEGLEHFSLDGIDYEAFNTSGGLGTLCETLEGKVSSLDYKTVRYQGHCYLMSFLTRSLKLNNRRELLKEILEAAVPITKQDVVLIACEVDGWRDGVYEQETNVRKVYNRTLFNESWSSIQITTAASMCAILDLHVQGELPSKGFVRQEQVSFDVFMANRFGQHYRVENERGL